MFRTASRKEKAKQQDHLTPVRQRPRWDVSLTGVIYMAIMAFMGLAAIQNRANLLFGVFGLMIGTLLVSGVISRLVLRGLSFRRVFPDHGIVGTTMRVSYQITNSKGYWPSLSVSVAEIDGTQTFERQPQCYMLHAAAGMTATIPADLLPKRRGLHELNRVQIGTGFPFGFLKRARMISQPEKMLIHPPLGTVDRRLLTMCRAAELAGITVRPQSGGCDEFYGVKQFRHGDNPRLIYWRRSARTGTLVSREMTRVAPPRLLLFVDTHRESDTLEAAELIERTIAMAASLASAAVGEGMAVGLVAWNQRWVAHAPSRGKQQRTDLLSTLAQLPVNRQHKLPDLLEQSHSLMRSGVTPVLFTPLSVEMGLIDEARGAMLVLSASSAAAREWFAFDEHVNFATAMPEPFAALARKESVK
jgi:uncharacterized protein (DUF58 family)